MYHSSLLCYANVAVVNELPNAARTRIVVLTYVSAVSAPPCCQFVQSALTEQLTMILDVTERPGIKNIRCIQPCRFAFQPNH